MKVNNKKCGIMQFQWRKKKKDDRKEFMGFPIVKKYKYLGGEISLDLKID
jgi:hypothetical protein